MGVGEGVYGFIYVLCVDRKIIVYLRFLKNNDKVYSYFKKCIINVIEYFFLDFYVFFFKNFGI